MSITQLSERATIATREGGRFKSKRTESYCESIIKASIDPSVGPRLLFTWEGNRATAYNHLVATTGYGFKTLQDWARAIEKVGIAILRDVTRTPLDSAREIDALGKLPAIERADLLNSLKRGENVSAV